MVETQTAPNSMI